VEISDIAADRIDRLNQKPIEKRQYVLYWMQQAQRAEWNHALEYAVEQANLLRQPVVVVFGLTENYPDANLRHFAFMLQGLLETRQVLEERGIGLTVVKGSPETVALDAAREASLVVCDRGFLRHQKEWRAEVGRRAEVYAAQIETDTVVPVETASHKAEVAARTLRPRIRSHLEGDLRRPHARLPKCDSLDIKPRGIEFGNLEAVLSTLKTNRDVTPVKAFLGGTTEARRRLDEFLAVRLAGYAKLRSRPELDHVSHLSPYLHFGQISALEVASRVMATDQAEEEDREAFLDELIVRRELAHNFVHFTPDYDQYASLPSWARTSLEQHAGDPRPHLYSLEQLEAAKTHDPYWNAAMMEMKLTGYMHNYMRMYWGKKILEWSKNPETAFYTILTLNNRFFLDGRDPSSYANVGWIFGLHDRPWPEKPIFGRVRYMSAAGLERKTDIGGYLARVRDLASGT
jgi:deoxyribodipyrimidine photo-lyase